MEVHIRPRRVRILGTGEALPARVVTSEELDRRLGLPAGSIEKLSGVRERRVEERNAAILGAEAARRALAAAGLGLTDLDAIVAVQAVPDQPLPCNAALLQAELAPRQPLPAWDVQASCLGFLVALDLLATAIDAGRYRHVLVVAAEIASVGLDWTTPEAAAIFGDGAAAVVLGPASGGPEAVLAAHFVTHADGAHDCEVPGWGSRAALSRDRGGPEPPPRFRMNGRALFRFAAHRLPPFVDELLAGGGMRMDDIDLVVPHQASHHGLRLLRQRYALPAERVVDIYAERGNQVAASLPSALHAAIDDGRLQRGQRALLLGTGAGLSLGGLILCL